MSWPAYNQAQAQWNPPGMALQDMNSGQYTPEQWAIMQQQNWHQWTQWQQQYSQWQNQYGDKYAQMQVVQNIGGIPPPPPSGPAPLPPPEKPPPPPPHENNQPLFNSNKDKPSPALNPPQPRNISNYNTDSGTGNNQWSYNTDKQPQPAVNSEDLKKLVEEERLFDIQFQKWEEEIDKWRQENLSHPDKQAYKDYEDKFEACRKQLLERRQQMKMKRASLLNTSTNSTGNTSIAPPQPPKNYNQNSYSQKPQSQNSQHNSYERNYELSQSSNENNIELQDRCESYNQKSTINNTYLSHGNDLAHGNEPDKSTFLQEPSSKGIPGLDLVPDSHANTKLDVIDLSIDEPEGQVQKGPDYSTISMGINNILGDEKIMNILSMVRGLETQTGNANPNPLNNDNTQFALHNQGNRYPNLSQPYGERKNNMSHNRQGQFPQQNQEFQPPNQGGNFPRQNPQQDQYFNQNNQYGGPGGSLGPDDPIGPHGPGIQQGGSGMMECGPGVQGGPGMRPSGPSMHQGRPGMHQMGPTSRSIQQAGPGMGPNRPGMLQGGPGMQQGRPGIQQGGSGMRPNRPGILQDGPTMRPTGPGMRHSGPSTQQSGPNIQHGSQSMQHSGQNMEQSGLIKQQSGPGTQQSGPNMQHGSQSMQHSGQNMEQRGLIKQQGGPNTQQPPPLMANRISMPLHPNRPPLQDMSTQQNYGGPEKLMPVPQQPKHKWVEVPLFTPSIVVEYEHKSLRLKARDFIEPVHTFDYNHISKDDEFKKKNFEHEADELFVRKPRRSEREYAEDRFRDLGNRDLFQRDYDRRGTRDDFRDMPRDIREIRGEPRDMRDLRDMRESRDIRDARGELRDMREQRDIRETKDMREPREFRDMREPRDFRDVKEPRDTSEPKAFRETDIKVRDEMNPRDRPKDGLRDDYERRRDDRHDDRRRDDRDRHGNRRVVNEDQRDRDRDYGRDRRDGRREGSRENRRDDSKVRTTSRDRDSRKRGLSHENEESSASKKPKDPPQNKPLVMIDDILEPPGRTMRPEKIVIILRGLPGSGKSYLAKLIRDREAEHGGTARIMSIDDYFMQESEIEETDPTTGKTIKKPSLKYDYDPALEETYINSLKRAFKRSLTDGYFSFLIYDAVNSTLRSYADIWNFSRQNGFQVYICTMEQDIQSCFKRNIHNRKLEDIEVIAGCFFTTPPHHIQLDATTLLQNAAITDVHMEDAIDEVVMDDVQEVEVESVFTSKWEKMDDAAKLARLDGTSKPLRPSQLSMEEYLQLDDWTPNVAKPGKKTVRWADIEERRQQEKMRAIGFVVGQTDWNRMTDPTMGSSALTQTKYIERNNRN